MKVKIGQKYKLLPHQRRFQDVGPGTNEYMEKYFGRVVTVSRVSAVNEEEFEIEEDHGEWTWYTEWIDRVHVVDLLPNDLFKI